MAKIPPDVCQHRAVELLEYQAILLGKRRKERGKRMACKTVLGIRAKFVFFCPLLLLPPLFLSTQSRADHRPWLGHHTGRYHGLVGPEQVGAEVGWLPHEAT